MAGGFFALNWLFLPLAAPFVGSFLGVVAARFPDWQSVAFGRSACPECLHRLGVRDLIPIMSWLAQRRSCRYCRSPIETFYPLMEVAALLVAVSATLIFSGWLLWASCLFGWALLAIAATDQRFMLLPDELTLPLIPTGVAINYALDSTSLYSHTAGAFIGFLSFFFIAWAYRRFRGRDGLGEGDAKLLAASGAWVSVWGLPSVIFVSATAALVVAVAFGLARRKLTFADKVPFGTYLCLGTWVVWLFGPMPEVPLL